MTLRETTITGPMPPACRGEPTALVEEMELT